MTGSRSRGSYHVFNGDTLETLKEIPDGVFRCCVTSPPYWGLRDYGVSGQLGLERTPAEYVERMVAVFAEVRRVLTDDGTLWLNLGDSYTGTKAHGLKPKDLVGIPWRVAFALQADGWVLRSEIVWAKPNPMPESVTDRPTKSHEQLFLLSKARWSGIVRPIACTDLDAAWLAALIDGEGTIGIGRTTNGGFQCHVHVANTNVALLERAAAVAGFGKITDSGKGTNRPVYRWQVTGRRAASVLYRVRTFLIAKRRQADNALALQESHRRYGGHVRPAETTTYQTELYARGKALNQGQEIDVPAPRGQWTARSYYYDAAAVTECRVRPGEAPGNKRVYDSGRPDRMVMRPNRGIGPERRNRRSVWTIPPKPFKGAHFAVMPEALVEPCILAGSAPGDSVLDPFSGSGTVGVVALRHGRDFIGIDLNKDYVKMSLRRIKESVRG